MLGILPPIKNPVLDPLIGATGTSGGNVSLAIIIANLYRTVVIVGGLALFIYLGWGGISWILAGGDKSKIEAARERITQSIIGMAILSATVAITILLNTLFGFDLLNPTIPTPGTDGGSSGTSSPTQVIDPFDKDPNVRPGLE